MTPPEIALLKRIFSIDVDHFWLGSSSKEKLMKFLMANGAKEVRRVGSSKHQQIYVSWVNDNRTNEELTALIQAAVEISAAT